MHNHRIIDSKAALARLMDGNREYVSAKIGMGNISDEIRFLTHVHGQKPYAVIVSCSDSRVFPEKIFMVGIGEIFTIRVAGNVIGAFELGSVEYAAQHLGAKLIVVMGTPGAARSRRPSKPGRRAYAHVTDEIRAKPSARRQIPSSASGSTCCTASRKNQGERIVRRMMEEEDMLIVGANYHTRSGEVELFEETLGGGRAYADLSSGLWPCAGM
jgi:carbonic anhydrase